MFHNNILTPENRQLLILTPIKQLTHIQFYYRILFQIKKIESKKYHNNTFI